MMAVDDPSGRRHRQLGFADCDLGDILCFEVSLWYREVKKNDEKIGFPE